MTFRVLYLSENIFATVQNRLSFSITWLNGASKDRLWPLLSPKPYEIRPKFARSVNRKPLGAYRKHCSDLTPSDLEPRYVGVKFPTFAVSQPAGRFRSNLSMLCHYHTMPTYPVNFVLIGLTTASQFNKIYFIFLNHDLVWAGTPYGQQYGCIWTAESKNDHIFLA